MKYKYLKDQNKSFRKQIEEQNQLINSQTILIDKLTSEKIDLLSKLEIKHIYKSFNDKGYINAEGSLDLKIMTKKIRIIDDLDIIIDKDILNFWENKQYLHSNPSLNEINQLINAFNKVSLGGRIFNIKTITDFINKERAVTAKQTKSKD